MPEIVIKSKKIIAALLTLALLACLPVGEANAAAKDYKDAEHGFSFSYPETWLRRGSQFYDVIMTSPADHGFIAAFAVGVFPPFDEAEMTAEAITEDYNKKIVDEVEILSYKKTELSGVPCVAVDMLISGGSPKETVREHLYMANRQGKGYVLRFAVDSEDYGKCVDSFKMILDSFKF